jgi:hypothetical protein
MFGRASSTPIQKLETGPGIAIVPCEALSKGPPEMKKITTQLVGGNARLVGENAIAFPCSEARNFHFGAGLQGSYGPRRKAARSRRTGCPAPRGREGPGFYGVEPIKFEKHEYFQFHMAVRN